MSKEAQQTQVTAVPLDAILAEMGELRRYIEALQTQINQLSGELIELSNSRELISDLKSGKATELMVPSDRRGHILLRVAPQSSDKVVAHVGVNIYVELSLEKAIEVLSMKERDVKEAIKVLQEELRRATEYYRSLQAVVSSALPKASK